MGDSALVMMLPFLMVLAVVAMVGLAVAWSRYRARMRLRAARDGMLGGAQRRRRADGAQDAGVLPFLFQGDGGSVGGEQPTSAPDGHHGHHGHDSASQHSSGGDGGHGGHASCSGASSCSGGSSCGGAGH